MPTPVLAEWMRRVPHARYTNLYGPTETTIASSYFDVPSVPDRRDRVRSRSAFPAPARQLLVLDEERRPLPPGEIGEIFIGGVGAEPRVLARRGEDRAAFGSPARTARADLRAPATSAGPSADGTLRLRRQGRLTDQAPRLPDRARRDRGGAERARRAARMRGGRDRDRGLRGDRDLLRLRLGGARGDAGRACGRRSRGSLPAYMLPTRWQAFDALPKNANGKIDRRSLREAFEAEAARRLVDDGSAFERCTPPGAERAHGAQLVDLQRLEAGSSRRSAPRAPPAARPGQASRASPTSITSRSAPSPRYRERPRKISSTARSCSVIARSTASARSGARPARAARRAAARPRARQARPLDLDPGHPHPAVGRGDDHATVGRRRHGAGLAARRPRRRARARDRHLAPVGDATGERPRRAKRPVVARPYEVDHLARRALPVKTAALWRTGAEQAPPGQVLSTGGNRRSRVRQVEQALDERQSTSNALRQHRQRGIVARHRKRIREGDRALIDPGCHPVKGHAVSVGALVQRPARRVQAGTLRERPRVQVERPEGRCLEDSGCTMCSEWTLSSRSTPCARNQLPSAGSRTSSGGRTGIHRGGGGRHRRAPAGSRRVVKTAAGLVPAFREQPERLDARRVLGSESDHKLHLGSVASRETAGTLRTPGFEYRAIKPPASLPANVDHGPVALGFRAHYRPRR